MKPEFTPQSHQKNKKRKKKKRKRNGFLAVSKNRKHVSYKL
jgi:hypothetical protein